MSLLRNCPQSVRAAFAIGLIVSGCKAPPPRIPRGGEIGSQGLGQDPSATIAELVTLHNQERSKVDLPPLTLNSRLEAAARRHAKDMAERHRMSHRGRNGSSPFRRMEEEGYSFQSAAENVAAGDFTVESVMAAWMTSPGHRRNILGNFSEIGASYAIAEDGRSYWCVTFGSPNLASVRPNHRISDILE